MPSTYSLVEIEDTEFAIVLVQKHIIKSLSREKIRKGFINLFPVGTPIILAAYNHCGGFTYHGSKEIIKIINTHYPTEVPWKKHTIQF